MFQELNARDAFQDEAFYIAFYSLPNAMMLQ